jgi:transposase
MRTPKDEQLRAKFFRIFGTDLTAIPSVNVGTVEVLLGEVGPDLNRFRSAGAFANWLGLCPNETITGGKVLASKTRKIESRLALSLRMAAESLCRDKSYLGAFYRHMKVRLRGAPQAITAAAHKLARIIYTLVVKHVQYDDSVFAEIEQRNREKQRLRLIKQARTMGYNLVPLPNASIVS